MIDEPLQTRYRALLASLRDAERAAQRPEGAVKLLAVSKNHPIAAIRCLAQCGQRDFAESRVQEALPKILALNTLLLTPPLTSPLSSPLMPPLTSALTSPLTSFVVSPLTWHFIGPIQSNKARAIANHFSWVHSVARQDIAQRLQAARASDLPPLQVCIQINCDPQADRLGVHPKDLLPLCEMITGCDRLRLRGLMAMPPATLASNALRAYFHQVWEAAEKLKQQGFAIDTLSMGMSQDFPIAIQEGATWVRIGTALFGARGE